MTGTTFASYIRSITGTNSTTFPDALIVTFANVVKDDLAAEIVKHVDEKYFEIELVRDLEAGVRDYTLDETIVKSIEYVSAKLDGTNAEYLREIDANGLASSLQQSLREETVIQSVYGDRDPEYTFTGRSLFILSGDAIIAVTGGLKIMAEIFPADIATGDLSGGSDLSVPSSDITHAIPRALHETWAEMVAIKYKSSREKPIPLTQKEKLIAQKLADKLNLIERRNLVRSHIASEPSNDGQDY